MHSMGIHRGRDLMHCMLLQGQLQEISADLMGMKSELHAAYSAINQKELEVERLQKLLNNATLDADNRYSG